MRTLIRFAVLLSGTICAANLFGPQSAAAQEKIHWQSDPQQAAQQAAEEQKLVMLHFTANWCGPCQTQKRFVFSNPTVARAVNESVVPVLVDIDENRQLAGELGVKTIPFDVFLTHQGEVVTKRSSPTDAQNFIRMVSTSHSPAAAPKSGALLKLAELKRRFDPMALSSHQRGTFGAEAPEIPSVEVSKEAIALAAKSNYGEQMSFRKRARKANAEKSLNPQLRSVFSALEQRTQTKDAGDDSEDPFFEIPASRPEQTAPAPVAAKVVTNPMSSQLGSRSHENLQRQAFLARKRPDIEIPIPPTDVKPVRVMNENFLARQMDFGADSLKTSTVLPGLQVSEMVDSRTGRALRSTVNSGRSIGRITTQSAPPQPSNQVRILPRQEHRIAGHALDSSFATQAALKRETPQTTARLIVPGNEMLTGPAEPDTPSADVHVNLDVDESSFSNAESEFCLKGKCPVTLAVEGKWVDGDARWGIIHRDRTYLFSSEENYRLFKEKPDHYSPVLAAYDPVVFHETGDFVNGLEENGIFMEKDQQQQIVLFSSAASRAKFQTNPQLYMRSVRQAIYAASRADTPSTNHAKLR